VLDRPRGARHDEGRMDSAPRENGGRRRFARRLPLVIALAGPIGLFGERISGGWIPPFTALAQVAPVLGIACVLAAGLAAAVRRRGDALFLGAGALLLAPATLGPVLTGAGRRGAEATPAELARAPLDLAFPRAVGADLRVLTANLGAGRSDGEQLARAVREAAADVLCLQEVGEHHVPALQALRGLYPHQRIEPRGIQGIGLASRFPLEDVEVFESARGRPSIRATVVLGRAGERRIRVLTSHPSAWVACLGRLDSDARELARDAAELVAGRAAGEAALLAGDLNTTERSWLHRRLRAAGLADAWRERGVGAGLSWPLFLRWRGVPAPPLVRIDHVLHSEELEVLAVRLGPDTGSDHVPVLCDLRWSGPGAVSTESSSTKGTRGTRETRGL